MEFVMNGSGSDSNDEGIKYRRHQRFWVKSYLEARLTYKKKVSVFKRLLLLGNNIESKRCLIKDISKQGLGIVIDSDVLVNVDCEIKVKVHGVDFNIRGTTRNCHPLDELPEDMRSNCVMSESQKEGMYFCGIQINDDTIDLTQIMNGLRVVEIT